MISSSSGIMVNTSGSTGIRVMTTSWTTVSLPNGYGLFPQGQNDCRPDKPDLQHTELTGMGNMNNPVTSLILSPAF